MELRAQLHLHTTESRGTRVKMECNITPKILIKTLKKNNINVAAITDHDNTRAYPKTKNYAQKQGIILISGIEISTCDGHLIGLNVDSDIDRNLKKGIDVFEARDLILDHGGEVYIPHPFDMRGKGIGSKIKDINGIVEVFNPGNIFGFEDKFARIVAERLKLPIAAASDAHWSAMLNRGITVVDSDPDVQSILETIKDGRVRFENCEYLMLKEIKNWATQRVIDSYLDIKDKLKNGWEVDQKYMKVANQRFLRLIQRGFLEFGVRRPNSRLFDIFSHFSYFFASLYGRYRKRGYETFISTII